MSAGKEASVAAAPNAPRSEPFGAARGSAVGVTDTKQPCDRRRIHIDRRSGMNVHYAQDTHMAFVRRKGNAYYLVHNVRQRGKIKQLHLARLGDRPRITDEIVRQVSHSHPLLDLDWTRLREELNGRVELFDPKSAYVQKLVSTLRTLNLDLADLFPPLLDVSQAPETAGEILTQLRLLHSTVQVKLNQFDQSPYRGVLAFRRFR